MKGLSSALKFIVPALISIISAATYAADPYPVKPIRVIVPFSVGPADTISREVAKELSDRLGQAIVIDQKPGAGGAIASKELSRANPDGYTLLFHGNAIVSHQYLIKNVGFDVTKNVLPVVPLPEGTLGLYVNPTLPVRTVHEFVTYAKANPGKLNYSSSGSGGTPFLAAEQFKSRAAINVVHIPYSGGNQAQIALVSNDVQMLFLDTATAKPTADSGRMRIIGVGSKQRSPLHPEVPTVHESGYPGFEQSFWYGLYAPVGTPMAIVTKLNDEIKKILADPAFKKRYAEKGYRTIWSSPEDFKTRLHHEAELVGKTLQSAGIQAE